MATQFDPRQFVNEFASAMSERDFDTVLDAYAENAQLEDPTTTQPVRGKENIRKNFEQWSRAFGEMKADVKQSIVSGKDVAILFELTGRHVGDLELSPGETVPATNKPVTLRVAEFVTLDDNGKVLTDRAVFDVASMMMQLGLLPSPQAAGRGKETTPTRSR